MDSKTVWIFTYFGKMIPFRRICKKSPPRFLDSKKINRKNTPKNDLKRSFDTSTFWSSEICCAGAALRQDWCLQAAFAARVTYETAWNLVKSTATLNRRVGHPKNSGLVRETFLVSVGHFGRPTYTGPTRAIRRIVRETFVFHGKS